MRAAAWTILVMIGLIFLGVLGVAAFAEGALVTRAETGSTRAEIVMSLPVWLQLVTPLLTIIGCIITVSIGVGKNKEILGQHSKAIEKLLEDKVEKELCEERHKHDANIVGLLADIRTLLTNLNK